MRFPLDLGLGRKVVTLASPVMAAMLTQTLINQADHVLVGHLPRAEAEPGQTALQISLILLWAVGGSLSAISVGTQALTARRRGEDDLPGAGQVLANSLAIAIVAGLAMSILAWATAPYVFPLVNRDPDVVQIGVPYLRWRYLQVMPMVISASYKAFFDGLGKTYVHMVAAIVMNVVNFVLAVALIFGKWGFPRMGVEGVGLASCISSFVGAALMFAWSMRREIRRDFRPYRIGLLKLRLVGRIANLSWPSAAAAVLTMTGFGLFLWIVGRLDAAAEARGVEGVYSTATANIINILQLVFITCIAYAQATETLVGQSLGAKKPDLAERYVRESLKIGVLFFLLVPGLLTMIFPHPIVRFFCHSSPQVADVAAPVLQLLGAFEPVICIALVITYTLYAAGNPRYVMYVEMTLHFGCLVPLSYFLALTLGLGLWGAWLAMIVYVCLLATLMYLKFRGGSWKTIQI